MSAPVLVSSHHLEQIAFDYGLTIEADAEFEYVTHNGLRLRALLGVSA